MNSAHVTTIMNVVLANGTSTSTCPSKAIHPPDDILPVLRMRYQVILPIFITAGILTNTFTACVAARPKLRALHFNLYILLISLLDLLGFIMRLPMVFDDEFCGYTNYSKAFYMIHFGWLVVNFIRGLCSYVLLYLSLDRFTGIWFPDTFRSHKGRNVGKKRVMVTAILLFFTTYIPWTFVLKVCGLDHHYVRHVRITLDKTGYLQLRFLKHFCALVLGIIPSFVNIGLNIGILVGFFKKNIYIKGGSEKMGRTAKRKFYHNIAVLTLNSSYAVCCLPYTITSLYMETGTCYSKSTYAKEVMIFLLESLSSLWSVSNMLVFFLLNKDCQNELKMIFRNVPLIKDYITISSQGTYSTASKEELDSKS